jgi:hypothetical protein
MSSLVISINSQRAPLSTYTFKLTRSYAVEQPEGEVGQWVCHANRVSARLSEPWYQNVQKWNRTRHYFRWRCWRARANLQTASELKVLILNRACILALRRSRPRDGKVRSIRRECVRRLCGLRTYVTCRARQTPNGQDHPLRRPHNPSHSFCRNTRRSGLSRQRV